MSPVRNAASTASVPSRPLSPARLRFQHLLPWLTAFWVFVQLLSLRLNLLRRFFFDTLHADVQGTDYFSLPRAWLNLQSGHSLYATFDPPAFGPHFTWYLAHPVLAIALGGPLSRLAPMDSYGAFTLLSLATTAFSAWLLARETGDALRRQCLYLLLLGSFPGYLMLWVGNVQAFTVLGLTLLLLGLLRLRRAGAHPNRFLLAGLLLSLFTKPVVLLSLPLLLLLRDTRRPAWRALAIYLPVSLLCEVAPALNPEAIGLHRVVHLATHPAFVRSSMNIYRNGLHLTPDMRDNSIHWFNLLAQSGFRLQHVDVYSLPVTLDSFFGHSTPDWLYRLPALVLLGLSFGVARLLDPVQRRDAALLLTMATSLAFFVTYPTVWEYQYTAVLPVAAVLLLAGPGTLLPPRLWRACVVLACIAWLPSLYFLSGSAEPGPAVLALARLDRVLPVTLLFCLLVWRVATALRSPLLRREHRTNTSAARPEVA